MMRLIVNVAVFQLGWFSCVLGAANGLPELGPVVVTGALLLHFLFARQPQREALLILSAGALGAAMETALVGSGWLVYPNGQIWAGAAPYWIVAMWLLFATTLNVSMRWLHGRPVVAALFGGIGGPLSYVAGERLGGLQFVDQPAALLALAFGWGLVTPLLVEIARHLDGFQPDVQTGARHA